MSVVYFNKDNEIINNVIEFDYAMIFTGNNYYKFVKKENKFIKINKTKVRKINLIKQLDIVPKFINNPGKIEELKKIIPKDMMFCWLIMRWCLEYKKIFTNRCLHIACILRDALIALGYNNIDFVFGYVDIGKETIESSHIFLMYNNEINLDIPENNLKYKDILNVEKNNKIKECFHNLILTDQFNTNYDDGPTNDMPLRKKLIKIYYKGLKDGDINFYNKIVKKIKKKNIKYFD